MIYVLDSSVAFKWLVPEVDSSRAFRLRDDFNNGIHELIAPDIFAVETIHALTRAERQGRVTPAEGSVLFKDLLKTLPLIHSFLPLLPRVKNDNYFLGRRQLQGDVSSPAAGMFFRRKCPLLQVKGICGEKTCWGVRERGNCRDN